MSAGAGSDWRAALAFARRDLRGGLARFRVFLICLALGAAVVASVGSVVSAIRASLEAEAQTLLGGDVEIELTYRFASPEERAAFDAAGRVSEIVDFRSMVRSDGAEPRTSLAQAKVVDAAYPLYGAIGLEPAMPLDQALAENAAGVPGAVAEQALLTQLDVGVGDRLRFGGKVFELRAVIAAEPDRAASGVGFGPRLMVSRAALENSQLAQPGMLFETEYRLRLDPEQDLEALRDQLTAAFPEAGWRWRDRRNGAPGVERLTERIGAFLTLVGLAALAVGGVGVAASVRSYLDGKTDTIATLKTLGAEARLIQRIYLLQVGALAALGVAAGVIVGSALPLLAQPWIVASLPVKAEFGLYARPMVEAAAYSGLTALLFSLPPLLRTRDIRAAALFRDVAAPTRGRLRWTGIAILAALVAALTAAAVGFTGQTRLALGFIGGVAAAMLALALAAMAIAAAARRAARAARGRLTLRLALSDVGGTGPAGASETRSAVLALGLGLTVLTAIGLVDVNLRNLVSQQLPERAPEYFVIDIRNDDLDGFKRLVGGLPGVGRIETAPMLRGVITAINDMSAEEWRAQGNVQEGYGWVLRGDRGVSYAAEPSERTEITAGEWWPADHDGQSQVSFSDEHGRGIGLSLGDRITVNVLGRSFTARVTSFRTVEFMRDGGINFLMVFDPATLRGAPHVHLATLYGAEQTPGGWLREIADAYPTVTAIRVRDVLSRAESAVRQIAAAARIAAAATLATGLAVLIGAAAAAQRRQIYDAAILKTLGATRAELVAAMTLRSALLGLAAGVVALGAGSAAAWAVMRFVMEADFVFDAATAGLIIAGGVGATLVTGALFAMGPLSARPARVLRARE